jgi:hypothetical protein
LDIAASRQNKSRLTRRTLRTERSESTPRTERAPTTPRSERSSSTSRTERSSTTPRSERSSATRTERASESTPASERTTPRRNEAPSLTSRFSDEISSASASAPEVEESRQEEERGGFFSGIVDRVVDTVREAVGPNEAADTESGAVETEGDEEGGFLSNVFGGIQDRVTEARDQAEVRREQEMQEAAEAYQEWSQDPDGLASDLNGTDLTELSNGERIALFQLTQEHDGVSTAANGALRDTFENIESFSDIPSDRGFQALLASGTDEELDERLSGLLNDELASGLASRLEDASGDEEADRALDRFIGDIEDIARTRPGLAHLLEEQATTVLDGAGDDISDARRADDNIFQRANHAVTGFARGAAGFVGDRLRDIGDIAGTALDTTLDFAGDLQEFTIDTVGTVAGGAADLVGADGVADNIREGAETLGDAVDAGYDFVGEQSGNFTRGFAEGAAGAVEGVTELVVNPVGTVQALGTLIQDPSLIIDSYQAIAEEHGVAGAIGAVGFDVVSTLAGGGGAAARVSSIAGRAATFLDDVGRVARVADNVGAVTDDIGRVAGRAGTVLDNLADGGAVSRAVANAGTNLADLGSTGFRNLGQAADTVNQFTQPLRNGVNQAVDSVVSPIRNGAGALADSALGQTVRNGVSRVVPDGIRHPVSRVRRGLNDLLTGDDSAEFAARSRALRDENPQIGVGVENARTQFRELKNEFGELENLHSGDALVGAQREALTRLIDPEGDIARLSREFDALSEGGAPGGVGDVLANSRVDALDFIRENIDTIDPNAARRILRGLVADGDPAGPAFLTQLRADDQIFRAFDSNGTADGGYFSRVSDSRFDPAEQIRVSALPYDPELAAAAGARATDAAAGAIAAVGEDSLALVTRLADQPGFGPLATGGGWQLQLFNDGNLRNRLSQVGAGGPISGALPNGVQLVEPGTSSSVRQFERAAVLLRRAQQINRISRAAGSFVPPVLLPQLDTLNGLADSEER